MRTILVAHDENRVIGKDNKIPWRNAEDWKLFKERTTAHPIVMGRKTWQSLPKKPLPNRLNLVVSTQFSNMAQFFDIKQSEYGVVHAFPSLEEALDYAKKKQPDQPIFIIGGEAIYRYALKHNLVDRIIVSLISGKHDGDTYFPELDSSWKEASSTDHKTFKEIVYERN